MTVPRPFRIEIPDEVLERIRARVAGYVWHEMPDDGGWAYGTNLDYMKALCAYWLEEFDWRAQEAKLNGFSHFTAPVEGIDIHFIHEKGSGPRRPCRSSSATAGPDRWLNSPMSSTPSPIPSASAAARRTPST